jgi:predicted DNA-binding transcriptional regulator YafY
MVENVSLPRRARPRLTAAEIAALGLSLAHLGAGPQSATARRALRHLFEDSAVPADDLIATTLATLTSPLDPATARRARVAAGAITARLVVRLHYTDVAGSITTREIEPVTCLVHRDHWYLIAWCRMRQGIRAFRFDRMLALEATEIPARPHRADCFLPFQPRQKATLAS